MFDEKKTSEEWQKTYHSTILDPDGWDRSNFDYSWYKENITFNEFVTRAMNSTVRRSRG